MSVAVNSREESRALARRAGARQFAFGTPQGAEPFWQGYGGVPHTLFSSPFLPRKGEGGWLKGFFSILLGCSRRFVFLVALTRENERPFFRGVPAGRLSRHAATHSTIPDLIFTPGPPPRKTHLNAAMVAMLPGIDVRMLLFGARRHRRQALESPGDP